MIRQDFYGSVRKVDDSMVLISSQVLRKFLGFYSEAIPENLDEIDDHIEKYSNDSELFIKKILDAGGDIVSMDTPLGESEWNVIKKYTVNEDGCNQVVLEIRPSNLNMTRFLMKNELTSSEFFKNRIAELGLSCDQLHENNFALRDRIMDEYKASVQS